MQSKKVFLKKCFAYFVLIFVVYIFLHIFSKSTDHIAKILTKSNSQYEFVKNDEDFEETTKKIDQNTTISDLLNFTKTTTTKEQTTIKFNDSDVGSDHDETQISSESLKMLKSHLKCKNRDFSSAIYQRGDYWVLKNYVKADHGDLDCHTDVTFVTHGDFTYLENLEILVTRWLGPVSMALYAPGTDLNSTVSSIRYLRDCSKEKDLIRRWVSFHVYFHKDHMPDGIPMMNMFNETFNCSHDIPYNVNQSSIYKNAANLLYPVNVGRNIARDASLTHFFLSLDAELYPVFRLGIKFLNMLARNVTLLEESERSVFVMRPFEVEASQKVPDNKTELIGMLKNGSAIPFHQSMCPDCHNIPHGELWMSQGQTKYLEVTGSGKRTGQFKSWEPLFISTQSIPYLEERLSWDGKRDKMTQTYVLCVLDYNFLILSNAFVVHHPGIKVYVPDSKRDSIVARQSNFIDKTLKKELFVLYGTREGCIL